MTVDDRHLTPDLVAGYLAGTLSPEVRTTVLSHLDECIACRTELIEVGGIVAEVRAGAPVPAARSSRRLVPVALALAAGLAAITIYRGRSPGMNPEAAVRAVDSPGTGEGVPAISVVEPADGGVVGDSVVLRWRSAGRRSFEVFLLDEDGRPLWTATTADTVVRVPATTPLRPGTTYFWRVDAMGNGIVASTGIRRLTVAR